MDQKTAINKVRKQGLEIQNLPEEFKNDELVVLAALENDEYALNFASNELKNNREFIKKVVKKMDEHSNLQVNLSRQIKKSQKLLLNLIGMNILCD